MARIKGPNGLVLTVPDMAAEDLVNGRTGDYEYVKDEPQSESKSTAKRSSSAKK